MSVYIYTVEIWAFEIWALNYHTCKFSYKPFNNLSVKTIYSNCKLHEQDNPTLQLTVQCDKSLDTKLSSKKLA